MMRPLFLAYAQFGYMQLLAYLPNTMYVLPEDLAIEALRPEGAQRLPEPGCSFPNHSFTPFDRFASWLASRFSSRYE
jgi:hypothetical protein